MPELSTEIIFDWAQRGETKSIQAAMTIVQRLDWRLSEYECRRGDALVNPLVFDSSWDRSVVLT
ncbi:hypothetical protein [Schlesneria paludicola]|uniref:hypothetical protein n=1 Tax=Schlesneria paludicola TaxID=360056 RepID=UPI00029B0633|nr:hypothetical protein [Schlesneria paludicola]